MIVLCYKACVISPLRDDPVSLDKFRNGDPRVLEAIYWEYVRKVERILSDGFEVRDKGLRVPGIKHRAADLGDLIQEVFLRAFSEKSRRAYDGLRDFSPYLYAIARNVLVDFERRWGRERTLSEAGDNLAAEPAVVDADETPLWSQPSVVQLVDRYLAGLPDDLKALHHLRYEQTCSQEEAARVLGLSRQNVRTLEKRLRDGLAALLETEGIVESDQPDSPLERMDTRAYQNGTQTRR